MFWVTCQKLLQSERANQLDAVSSWALQHFNDRSLLITRTTELCDTSFSCNLPCPVDVFRVRLLDLRMVFNSIDVLRRVQ